MTLSGQVEELRRTFRWWWLGAALALLGLLAAAVWAYAATRPQWVPPRVGEIGELSGDSSKVGWPEDRGDGTANLRWELGPGSGVTTQLIPAAEAGEGRIRTVVEEVRGTLRLDLSSCPGAAIRWSLLPGGDSSSGVLDSGAPSAELSPVPFGEGTTALRLRIQRTDPVPCRAALDWDGASILRAEES